VKNTGRALTKAGNESTPSIDLVLKWIADAWASVPSEMIVASFASCGITAEKALLVTQMQCFSENGQLSKQKEIFLAAYNATQ
jgi:hypothetical protein